MAMLNNERVPSGSFITGMEIAILFKENHRTKWVIYTMYMLTDRYNRRVWIVMIVISSTG